MMLIKILTSRKFYIYTCVIIYTCVLLTCLFLGYNSSQENCSQETICADLNFSNRVLLFTKLLINNEKCIIQNYGGIFSIGLLSIASIIRNASAFGFVLGAAIQNGNYLQIFSHVFPHSFEAIAYLLACADSAYLGIIVFLKIICNYQLKIKFSLYVIRFLYYLVITALAALVEAFISI